MQTNWISMLLFLTIIQLTAGTRLWSSKSSTKRWKWRGAWKMDRSTYIGIKAVKTKPNPAEKRGKVNVVLHKQGSYGLTTPDSGAEFYATPVRPRRCLTLTYRVWFEDGFDFAYGGKLPGLYGGGANCTAGTDPGKDCFTSRFIWRPEGKGGLALFTSRADQTKEFCNSSDVECNDDWGHRLGSGSFTFEAGRWYVLTQTVRLNTPGKANGYIRFSVAGTGKVYKTKDVMVRTSDINVDGIFFSNFFGGSSSCSASPVDTKIFFNYFVLKDTFC